MDVKYQVFVSSTFTDLIEERRSVIEMILNLGHIPVGMEAFQASDDTQWEYIKRRIDQSDYYVVIVAERYGSELKGKSYTQMEYEYAVKQGVPVAAFLLHDAARPQWPNSKTEPAKRDKVERFRKLCQKKMVKHWQNNYDLAGQVALALPELMREKPRGGWVRADTVPGPNVLAELTKLSEEKRLLSEKLEKFTSHELVPPPDVRERLENLNEQGFWDYLSLVAPENDDTSLLEVIRDVLPEMVMGARIEDIQTAMSEISNIAIEDYETFVFVKALIGNNLATIMREQPDEKGVVEPLFAPTPYGTDFLMYADRWVRQKKVLAQ